MRALIEAGLALSSVKQAERKKKQRRNRVSVAVAVLFDGKQPDAGAGNSIRCSTPVASGRRGLVRITHTGTLGTLPAHRQP